MVTISVRMRWHKNPVFGLARARLSSPCMTVALSIGAQVARGLRVKQGENLLGVSNGSYHIRVKLTHAMSKYGHWRATLL